MVSRICKQCANQKTVSSKPKSAMCKLCPSICKAAKPKISVFLKNFPKPTQPTFMGSSRAPYSWFNPLKPFFLAQKRFALFTLIYTGLPPGVRPPSGPPSVPRGQRTCRSLPAQRVRRTASQREHRLRVPLRSQQAGPLRSRRSRQRGIKKFSVNQRKFEFNKYIYITSDRPL